MPRPAGAPSWLAVHAAGVSMAPLCRWMPCRDVQPETQACSRVAEQEARQHVPVRPWRCSLTLTHTRGRELLRGDGRFLRLHGHWCCHSDEASRLLRPESWLPCICAAGAAVPQLGYQLTERHLVVSGLLIFPIHFFTGQKTLHLKSQDPAQ